MGPNDTEIPVQEVRTVYKFDNQTHKLTKAFLGAGPTYISHFEGCPSADSFSRRKKR